MLKYLYQSAWKFSKQNFQPLLCFLLFKEQWVSREFKGYIYRIFPKVQLDFYLIKILQKKIKK